MRLKIFFIVCLSFLSLVCSASDVVWYNGKSPVSYSVCEQHDKVVDVALDLFSSDMQAVTGRYANKKSNSVIEIYQLDRLSNKEFGQLSKYSIPINQFITQPDAFYLANTGRKVVVVGSNGRGTAYGILELSRLAGVSPWIWWGDVRPATKDYLIMKDGYKSLQIPSVRYRGLSIGGEDWSLRPWSKTLDHRLPEGAIGPRTYKKLFELMLRLRANLLWPADDLGTTPFNRVRGNLEVADSCAIIVGSKDPLLRDDKVEWGSRNGEYNYADNHRWMQHYWEEGLKTAGTGEKMFTVGLGNFPISGARNEHDKRQLLQKAVHEQLKLIKKTEDKLNKKNKNAPADYPTLILANDEVRSLLGNGLQLPDATTVLWPDDGYGYLLPAQGHLSANRKGGAGVLVHLSYQGAPHDCLWLSTPQPGLLVSQLDAALARKAYRVWIAEIHEPKVAAYALSLFFDKAWNTSSVTSDHLEGHLTSWLSAQFGQTLGQRLLPVMREYYRLTAIRKPEFMGWNQLTSGKDNPKVNDTEFSTEDFGNELERYLSDFRALKNRVDELSQEVPAPLRSAFFAAVAYPVKAAEAMARKQLCAQESREISRPGTFHHDEEALEAAAASLEAYDDLCSLSRQYDALDGGKWAGLMNMSPRDLSVFSSPSLPDNLSQKERRQYGVGMELNSQLDAENATAATAARYDHCSGMITTVPFLGHSQRAVRMAAGSSVDYNFHLSGRGDALLYLAFVPVRPQSNGSMRVSVSFDGGKPIAVDLACPQGTDEWKKAVLRGQLLKKIPLAVDGYRSNHTLRLTAIDDGVMFDQWMIDFVDDRTFYMIPTK